MSVYLVTYDLNKETSRPNILKTIKEEFDGWACLSESSYAISTSLSADDVYNMLTQYIDEDDCIYVLTLKKPMAGFGNEEVNDWLDENLQY